MKHGIVPCLYFSQVQYELLVIYLYHAESAIAYIVQVVYIWHIRPREYMYIVAISEADVDASKKPITAKDTEVAFSITFFAVMGFCWHPHPLQKQAAFCSRF